MKILPVVFAALLAVPVAAQEPTPTPDDAVETVIVVTADRNPRPLAQTTSAITVITRAQIEAKAAFDLTDAIRLAPGISLAQSGTRGKTVSIFTRGTNSNHTLVLIDGVRANSPQDGRFDFGQIPVENVERIEVLRGPQSALYGSDAIGGVINIITRRGSGEFKTGARAEFGNYATNRQVVTANGEMGKTRLSFAASRLKSGGVFENDKYTDNGASLRLDHALSPKQNLAFTGRISAAKYGVPGDRFVAPEPLQGDRSRDATASLQWTNNAPRRRDQVTLGVYDRYLRDDDLRDASGFGDLFTAKDRVRTLDAQSAFVIGAHTLTLGGEERREVARTTSNFGGFNNGTTTHALFLQDEFRVGKLSLVPGVRRERNSQYGGFTSYRLASAYEINEKTRLKATYGTAFKAPAFIFLYYPGFSNPNLQPERSQGAEIGLERRFLDGGRFEATFFHNRIRDLIDGGLLLNVNSARTRGLELELDAPFGKGFRAVLNQTFTNISASTATPLTRRPKFNTSADVIANRGRWNYDLGLLAQGERYDRLTFGTPVQKFGGYGRLDFTLGHQIRPGVEIYARAQNLLNKRYDEVAGYPAPGFNLVFGVKTASF